ncbi:DNA ligase D [Asticcacaulis excentricus]|uniref:DNA ligase (ATP) n=1 Tax=Asticcacaulis excentricus (strain ATCC 15261 / DSM 4724 / KCTC 12464 / NCIMB 9791 / VKM B-1370 / CB 48) TaxID=573065 RepID=E8RPE4_ASTEC|nr:DNA ligase D [Asticcacaulis excentricus]ADU13042.1 DNA ligase D [Asticcacaulis excentricus CB 48]
MGLDLYNKKRDFAKTAEPEGKPGRKSGQRFLIQKHDARRLHYDFRLELDGVLKSWAVTRGPSPNPQDKRLAVEVEDHPVAYGTFEGIIPKGQYGGGTVMMWDEGTWEPLDDPHKGLKAGSLKFVLHGKRLSGEWALVRMKPRPKGPDRANWLLIKHDDAAARDDAAEAWLETQATSITTGRRMEEIATNTQRVWTSRTRDEPPKRKQSKSMLEFIEPELATLAVAVPKGKDWVHEIKFDGYRTQALIENGEVRLLTRTGLDWTHRFRPLPDYLAQMPVTSAILDGEIVAVDEGGRADFKTLQATLAGEADVPLQFYVFDLLHSDGEDLRALPLVSRKARLQRLFNGNHFGGRVHYSEHFTKDAADLKDRLCALDQEGLICKRANAPYHSGRNRAWLKVKCHKRQEFVIGGFTLPKAGSKGIGALLIGYFQEGRLTYAGKVGTGFTLDSAIDLRRRLDLIAQKYHPFSDIPPEFKRGAHWVAPHLVAEVQFGEWTSDGRLRHPSFQGLREDKPPQDIHRDRPLSPTEVRKAEDVPAARKPKRRAPASEKSPTDVVGGVAISSPDRVVFPGTDITKKDVAEYYLSVADHILPHIAGRPISTIRCPQGIGGQCFFQRHLTQAAIPHVNDTGLPVNGREDDYIMITDAHGLISLMQWGVMEIHPRGCMATTPNRPDRLIFDLDPDPEADWADVVAGAAEVRERMTEFDLQSFLKTTGGKGLHVVIPIQPQYDWSAIKAFTRAVAESMTHDSPRRFVAQASKSKRKGRVFIDYLRNDFTATAVAPYAVRARPGAPVAMPIDWKALSRDLDPAGFTLENTPAHLGRRKADPWADMARMNQRLSPKILKALNII